MILIISALNTEVNFLKEHCKVICEIGKKPFKYFKCTFKNIEFLLAKSGLGKIRTASFLQYSIDNFKDINLIVNFGSAGAVADNVTIGDTFFCTRAIEYDFYTTRKFKPQFEINFEPFCNTIINELGIKKGIIVSGTQNVDSKTKKIILFKEFNADIGDWEASAIAQVCQLNNKICFIFKTVTDLGDENLLSDYKNNYKLVLNNGALKVLEFIVRYIQVKKK